MAVPVPVQMPRLEAIDGRDSVSDLDMAEMLRLSGERQALVATGIYDEGDALIQQLDPHIGRLHAAVA